MGGDNKIESLAELQRTNFQPISFYAIKQLLEMPLQLERHPSCNIWLAAGCETLIPNFHLVVHMIVLM